MGLGAAQDLRARRWLLTHQTLSPRMCIGVPSYHYFEVTLTCLFLLSFLSFPPGPLLLWEHHPSFLLANASDAHQLASSLNMQSSPLAYLASSGLFFVVFCFPTYSERWKEP